MKKILTLIFSLSLLTSAFAQSEHRQQNQNDTYQSSRYQYAYNSNDRHGNYGDRDEYFSPKYNSEERA